MADTELNPELLRELNTLLGTLFDHFNEILIIIALIVGYLIYKFVVNWRNNRVERLIDACEKSLKTCSVQLKKNTKAFNENINILKKWESKL